MYLAQLDTFGPSEIYDQNLTPAHKVIQFS